MAVAVYYYHSSEGDGASKCRNGDICIHLTPRACAPSCFRENEDEATNHMEVVMTGNPTFTAASPPSSPTPTSCVDEAEEGGPQSFAMMDVGEGWDQASLRQRAQLQLSQEAPAVHNIGVAVAITTMANNACRQDDGARHSERFNLGGGEETAAAEESVAEVPPSEDMQADNSGPDGGPARVATGAVPATGVSLAEKVAARKAAELKGQESVDPPDRWRGEETAAAEESVAEVPPSEDMQADNSGPDGGPARVATGAVPATGVSLAEKVAARKAAELKGQESVDPPDRWRGEETAAAEESVAEVPPSEDMQADNSGPDGGPARVATGAVPATGVSLAEKVAARKAAELKGTESPDDGVAVARVKSCEVGAMAPPTHAEQVHATTS
eukprot:gene8965-10620_t